MDKKDFSKKVTTIKELEAMVQEQLDNEAIREVIVKLADK